MKNYTGEGVLTQAKTLQEALYKFAMLLKTCGGREQVVIKSSMSSSVMICLASIFYERHFFPLPRASMMRMVASVISSNFSWSGHLWVHKCPLQQSHHSSYNLENKFEIPLSHWNKIVFNQSTYNNPIQSSLIPSSQTTWCFNGWKLLSLLK